MLLKMDKSMDCFNRRSPTHVRVHVPCARLTSVTLSISRGPSLVLNWLIEKLHSQANVLQSVPSDATTTRQQVVSLSGRKWSGGRGGGGATNRKHRYM